MPGNKPAMPTVKGKEIVDPQMAVFIKLDDLQRVFKKELTLTRDVMVQLLKVIQGTSGAAPILLVEKLEQIRHEIAIRRDEGEYKYYEDTATTTETIYDFIRDFGFPIKSYTLINDSDNDILLGHMSEEHLLDVSPERFGTIKKGETFPMLNNNPVVRKIIIKTDSGTADYRLWILW